MKEIEVEITQEQCDEVNLMQERLFGKYSEELKEVLGIKKYIPHKLKCWFG